jgi:hypothetical protein
MSVPCEITPISAFQSTNLNSKIESFDRLGERILRALGYPLVTVEIHKDQLYENISIAVEMFTKFAGYTKEYLVFDSNLYIPNVGIPIDILFTLAKTGLSQSRQNDHEISKPNVSYYETLTSVAYVCISAVPSSTFTSSSSLSVSFPSGIPTFELISNPTYGELISFNSALSANFKSSYVQTPTIQQVEVQATKLNSAYDYDILDYRKVMAITEFQEGSTQGINTLFTLEQTLAQQTYFSYAMGNYGFDLVSWYTMKEWIDMREKVLAIKRSFEFNDRTQILKMFPQPNPNGTDRFYGVLNAYIEKPIRDVIKEQWVYQYALALSKISVGRVRGKFGQVQLLGGGSLNYDLLEEGRTEKSELERQLYEGASAGLGDTDPILFIVG